MQHDTDVVNAPEIDMTFIRRDDAGQIVAVSREPQPGFSPASADDAAEVEAFLLTVAMNSDFLRSDLQFIRVLDDLLEVMMEKNLLVFTDLPPEAQEKVMLRNQMRSLRRGHLDILEDEGPL